MRNLFYFLLLLIISCKPAVEEKAKVVSPIDVQNKTIFQQDDVFVDNQFEGARANDFLKLTDTSYQIIVKPENTPVNKSAWFAFKIWSKKKRNVVIEIKYTEHSHRFIPKISMDGLVWTPMNKADYKVDTANQSVLLYLNLTPEKRWISAQELITTSSNDKWLEQLSKKDFVGKSTVGKSLLNKDISLLTIKEGNPTKSIVIVGRQHPPEVPGGSIALMSFVERLVEAEELANNFREEYEIMVFPMLNPDGVDMGHWRHNANGKDLNRDWQDFSQPETQAVKDYLSTIKTEVKFGIDFHTSFSGPYLLVQDTVGNAPLPKIVGNWIQRIKQVWPQKLDIRPRAQNLPYCYNYFINELNAEAVTYEDGDEIDRTEVKNRAKVYAEELMKVLLEN